MSATQLVDLAQSLEDARGLVDKRMDLVHKADTLPNGFRVLTAFQKKISESQLGSDPEQEKIWNETAKQVEREKEKKEKDARQKKPSLAAGNYPRGGIANGSFN